MANVLLTTRCNRKCRFCFAQSRLGRSSGEDGNALTMSRENVGKVMDWLESNRITDLRLLGGEPTMHPEFIDIVKEGLERGFHVHLFTNAIMSKTKADFLGDTPPDRVSMLCNLSPQADDTPAQQRMREYALGRLGKRANPGLTVTSPEIDYGFLLEAINRHGLRRHIRVGVAQPIVGKDNAFARPEQYREIGRAISAMARHCFEEDILIGFDCGMTLCMFSEEELGVLMTRSEGFKRVCEPIIDIGPGLEVWACFPLSEVFNTHLSRFPNRKDLVRLYERLTRPYRALGCMPQCMRCDYLRRGQCYGGCLAHAMNAMNKMPPRLVPSHGA